MGRPILETNDSSLALKRLKQSARKTVRYHVAIGKLLKPSTCSSCLGKLQLEAHHPDYTRPLEIVWLCKGCHIIQEYEDKDRARAVKRELLELIREKKLSNIDLNERFPAAGKDTDWFA